MCCSVLQYVAVCCSVLQCVAVCSIVLQCVASSHMTHQMQGNKDEKDIFPRFDARSFLDVQPVTPIDYAFLKYVAVCCSVLQCVAARCSALQYVLCHP